MLPEVPAVSLTIASERTGLSRGYLKQLCPEQCATLGSRYRTWRHEAHEQRKMELFAEVCETVRQLRNQGRCPSIGRVTSLLSPSTLKDWKTIAAAVKAAREAIENE